MWEKDTKGVVLEDFSSVTGKRKDRMVLKSEGRSSISRNSNGGNSSSRKIIRNNTRGSRRSCESISGPEDVEEEIVLLFFRPWFLGDREWLLNSNCIFVYHLTCGMYYDAFLRGLSGRIEFIIVHIWKQKCRAKRQKKKSPEHCSV